MLIYAARRIALTALILLVTMTLLFSMVYLVPGDPASIALGPRATAAMKEMFRQRMGLDQPLPVQLWRFISNVLQGNLGIDVWSNRSVAQIVLEALPYTLALAGIGLGWAVATGIPPGLTVNSAISCSTLFSPPSRSGSAGSAILRAWSAPQCWR